MKTKIFLTLALIFTWNLHAALACRCEEPNSVKEEFEHAEMVVLGKVVQKNYVEIGSTMDADQRTKLEGKLEDWEQQMLTIQSVLKIEIEVQKQYKGDSITEKITIYTARNAATCGFSGFEVGETFLVYADEKSYLYQLFSPSMKLNTPLEKENTFWTNQCMRTTANYEADVAELEQMEN